MKNNYTGTEIAIVGMSCRFPGAQDIHSFWDNLQKGVESISKLDEEAIIGEGEDARKLKDPKYVKANAFIENKEYFDSKFFGFRSEEAQLLDPQTRIFLEICWAAMEDAGYDVLRNKEKVGLFAGATSNLSWMTHALKLNVENYVDDYSLPHLSNVIFLCSRVSYLLNLTGPSVYLDTACSTSLLAVQRACMSLLLRECQLALAGGVTIRTYSNKGYVYQEGMLNSQDGHCRVFDKDASGIVSGEGAGVLVLKKLDKALEDGNHIYAIIKGSGITNDGAEKMAFATPSVDGQYKAVLKALNMAQVSPESISYVEAHSTANELGDALEVEALNMAFGKQKEKHCAIGSVKTNIGHADAAAGIAGLIKTVLALQKKKLPPSLNFKTANPKINFDGGPFYVNTELKEWKREKYPLRAGVSAAGVAGTNVHLVLEEAPLRNKSSQTRAHYLLPFSAKSPSALESNIQKFAQYLQDNEAESLADIAYTLQKGRAQFAYRKVFICSSKEEALQELSAYRQEEEKLAVASEKDRPLILGFPRSQVENFTDYRKLYKEEEAFRFELDNCLKALKEFQDSQEVLNYFSLENLVGSSLSLENRDLIDFMGQYALASLLMKQDLPIKGLIAEGVGEYVAACIGGVFSLEDGLSLVLKREELKKLNKDEREVSFKRALDKCDIHKPRIPIISAYGSHTVTIEEISDPQYWIQQMDKQPKASDRIKGLQDNKASIWIEVGPDKRFHDSIQTKKFRENGHQIIPLHGKGLVSLLSFWGDLWLAGMDLDWDTFYEKEERSLVPLPSYAFDKIKYPVHVNSDSLLSALLTADSDERAATLNTSQERKDLEEVSPSESNMLALWRKFFDDDSIKPEDNFFEVGGNSLRAMTMISRIHKHMGASLSTQEFFAYPTVKSLSKYILSGEKDSLKAFVPIPKAESKEYYKLSSGQKRLFFLYEFDPSSIAYNLPGIHILKGELDKKRLSKAFQDLVDYHESLRTSVKLINNEAVQKINKDVNFEIEFVKAKEAEAATYVEKFIRPFDVNEDSLFRVGLIELDRQKHILMVDTHHIISDGVSGAVLLRDFMAIYRGEALPDLRLQYKDYAEWQQSKAQLEQIAEQRAFWLNEFSEEINILNLPTDYERPSVLSFRGNSVSFELDAEESNNLKSLAEKEGATLFIVLLSAYNVLLSKLSNQEDIIVGTPVANRQHADFEEMIGMFVNTIALRNFPTGTSRFKDFLSEVKTKTLACFDHQSYSYEELVDELNIQRETGRNALFDCTFVLQNTESSKAELAGIKIEDYPYQHEISQFDLTLEVVEVGDKISCTFKYATDLFKKERIESFSHYFRKIISAVNEDPNISLADIDILSDEEKEQLLFGLNNTQKAYPQDKSIGALFDEQAAKYPDHVALWYEDQTMTYRELHEKSNQLASYLRKKGVLAESKVGLMLERSFEMVIGIMGIIKAGGAYVPIDPAYPQERISYIIEDSQAMLLLLKEDAPENLQFEGERILIQEALAETPSPKQLEDVNSLHDLLYIIYTSGSTGKPKGVMVEHKSVLSLIYAQTQNFNFGTEERVLQVSSMAFDASVEQIFLALLNGASIVLVPKSALLDEKALGELIHKSGATHLHATPSYLINLLRDMDLAKIGSLKRLVSGGEPCPTVFADEWKNKVEFFNEYGPTETTITNTLYPYLPDLSCSHSILPLGKPIQNNSLYILDAYGKLLPFGTPGELYIGGDLVSRGYFNKAELSQAKFIDHPYIKGEKIYKSGDVAQWIPGGNMKFLGRIDDQVKIRGYRIEPGEIEHQLTSHPKIEESVVLAREVKGEKHLLAYFVSTEKLETNHLREYLSDLLSAYMIPSYFVQISEIPLTSNGKLDRKSLPDPEIKANTDHIAAQKEEEKLLVEVWTEVLGVEGIGITDNFFSLGGDSIKSIQISSRLRNAGYKLSIQDLFISQTIKELAPKLERLEAQREDTIVEGPVPLGPIQADFFQRPLQNKHHYNQSIMLHFPEGISAEDTLAIFEHLQFHHDALRMVFVQEERGVLQNNRGIDVPVSLEDWDLRQEEKPVELCLKHSQRLQANIDLEKGPLMKLGLFHMQDGSRLLIVIHHLVIDGVSWRVLFEDFESLYQQQQEGQLFKLPPKTTSFKTWVENLQAYSKSKTSKDALSYWEKLFHKSYAQLKADFPNGSNSYEASRVSKFRLDKKYTEKLLRNSHKAFNTQINDLLLAALLLTIQKKLKQHHLLLELEGHGREEIQEGIDVSRTVGWFTSIYPVLLSSENTDLSGLIKEVKESLRSIPNQGIDYLLQKYKEEASDSWEKLHPQIVFNYLGQFDADLEGKSFSIAAESVGDEISQEEEMSYEWDFFSMVREGRLEMNLRYSSQRYKADRVDELMDSYQQNLKDIIKHCAEQNDEVLTPSDLSYKGLSISDLDHLQTQYEIEDIYPLSPMQEGMHFHAILDAESEYYFEQTIISLEGRLSMKAIKQSMAELLQRYANLRTIFLHEGYERPIQIVLKNQKLDIQFHDIREACKQQSKEEIRSLYFEKDRARKFELSKGELIRLTVLQTADEEFDCIWSNHHILMDGWCLGIIFNDFNILYQKHLGRKEIALPAVKPYVTYIDWLERREKESSQKYWKSYVDRYTELTKLPSKVLTAASTKGYQKESYPLILGQEKKKKLDLISQKYGVTLNTILQTAWGIMLSKYNDADDVVFGAVVSGRPAEIEGIERMIGLFINTLPVRLKLEANQRIGALLKQVQQKALESEKHHFHPLSEIQAQSELGRDLLDHILVFENYPVAAEIEKAAANKDSDFEVKGIKTIEQNHYDLSILIIPAEEIEIYFQYNPEVYDPNIIEIASGHLKRILDQIVENPTQKLGDINMLTAEEQNLLLNNFTDTEAEYPHDKTILDLFEEEVKKNPGNIAIVYEGEEISYQELDIKANQLGHYLKIQGVKEETLVGLCMEKSIDLMIAMLAILKAGAAYVPIDPSYPAQRISYIIEDTQMDIIVSKSEVMNALKLRASRVSTIIPFDLYEEEIGKLSSDPPLRNSSPENLIYIIYTSGSTGKPKGVLIEHKSVVNLISALSEKFEFSSEDRVLQISSISFDASVEQIYLAFSHGAKIVLVSKETLIDKEALGAVIREQGVTHLHATPSYLINLMASLDPQDLGSLKRLISGGEPCSTAFAEKWKTKVNFFNEYGPTETTITNTVYPYTPDESSWQSILPIGKPLPNNYFYILDSDLQAVPIGIPGEIYIGGVTLCRGYLNRPELNREKFIENPFDKKHCPVLYKSGDKARWLPDGKIEILGRTDDQIKVRGYRIEPGEIENQLSKHPHIRQAYVIGKGKPGEKYLVAYYTADQKLASSKLKKHLLEELPEYMVPGFYIHLEQLPLTSHGKVDKKALPDIEIQVEDDHALPTNEVEEKLLEIWSEVLKVEKEKISLHSNFFEIGGESLKALAMIGRIQQELDIQLGIKDFFKHSSIGKLSEHILSNASEGNNKPVRAKLVRAKEQEYYPASPTQERMYYQHLLHKEGAAFNISLPLEIKGEFEVERFRESFQSLLDRHENLRTSFYLSEEGVIQKINEGYKFQLELIDQNDVESVEQAYLNFKRSFDLSQESLLRAAILLHKERGNFLFIEVHHIVADKISFDILLSDFMDLYYGKQLTPLAFRYVDYASWIKGDRAELETQESFWAQKLSGNLTRVDMPIVRDREGIDIQKAERRELYLKQELSQEIRRMTTQADVSDFMLFLSIYYIFLYKISDSSDIIIGTEVLGRTHEELSSVVGNFINVLPLRMQLNTENSYEAFLWEVKDAVLEALENQDFQFDKMVSLVNEQAELNRNPIFDAHFSVSPAVKHREESSELAFVPLDGFSNLRGEYEFSIDLREDKGQFLLSFSYRSELYDQETIDSLMVYYHNIVKEVVRDKDILIQDIEIESIVEQAY